MRKLREEVRETILRTARRQFLQKGYLKSSMREIASAAEVGVGNIYNYFPNKDAIFREVVAPLVQQFERMLQRHHGAPGADILYMATEAYFREAADEYETLIEKHGPLMRILFFRAQGSSLENFREQFTDRATVLVKEWFAENKRRHPEVNVEVSDFFIHLHTVWMFSLFEEIIMHRIGQREMQQIVEEYIRFEIQGWRYLMKI